MAEKEEEASQDLKEKYMELQMIDQQMKRFQKQLEAVESHRLELLSINQSLDDIKNVKAGTEILVPMSSGIFAKANIQEPEHLIVNVGANIAVAKNISDTKKLLEKQLNELKKVHQQIMGELQELAVKAGSIEQEMKALVKNR